MKQLLVICGLLILVTGCATTPPQDSVEPASAAVTPGQPSQPSKAVAKIAAPAPPETTATPASTMIEVVVPTEPTTQPRRGRQSQQTIAIVPAPPTPSYDPKPLRILIDDAPLHTRGTQARQHEDIVIIPRPTLQRTYNNPDPLHLRMQDKTPSYTRVTQHENILIIPRPASPHTPEPRLIDVSSVLTDEASDTEYPTETFIITPNTR